MDGADSCVLSDIAGDILSDIAGAGRVMGAGSILGAGDIMGDIPSDGLDRFVLLCWFYWTGHGVEKFPVKVQVGTITVAYVVEYSLARKGANEDGAVTFLVQRGRAALHRFSVKRVSAI